MPVDRWKTARIYGRLPLFVNNHEWIRWGPIFRWRRTGIAKIQGAHLLPVSVRFRSCKVVPAFRFAAGFFSLAAPRRRQSRFRGGRLGDHQHTDEETTLHANGRISRYDYEYGT